MVESKFNDLINGLRYEHLTDWHGIDYSEVYNGEISIEKTGMCIDYKTLYIPYDLYITGHSHTTPSTYTSPEEDYVKITASVEIEEVVFEDYEEYILSSEQQDQLKKAIEEIIKNNEE